MGLPKAQITPLLILPETYAILTKTPQNQRNPHGLFVKER